MLTGRGRPSLKEEEENKEEEEERRRRYNRTAVSE